MWQKIKQNLSFLHKFPTISSMLATETFAFTWILEMHCVMAWHRFGHKEAGRVKFAWWGKPVMASITYPARTYFLPVREERQWHTKKMPKRISQSTFMHLKQCKKAQELRKHRQKPLFILLSGLLHETFHSFNTTLESH